jgi:hypothetical protein
MGIKVARRADSECYMANQKAKFEFSSVFEREKAGK